MKIKGKQFWRVVAAAVCMVMLCLLLGGCGAKNEGRVYYLNFKPEQDAAWQALAKTYTEKTGVPVTVLTAAEGQYEATLTGEMDKRTAPTLFQVNGPVGLANWRDYCLDLSGSEIAGQVTDDSFLLRDGDKIAGVAYAVESYGLIYAKPLLDKYFAADFATVKRAEDIRSFDTLSRVVREIEAHKKELGVDAAFCSAGMDASSDWRFKTHLANLPIFYEYRDRGIDMTDKIEGTYLDQYKQIWDLYINNATVPPNELSSKTVSDAETEFATGKAVFYQNGTWAYDGIKSDGKTGWKDDELGFLPIYIGVPGEEQMGLCTGSENYWCVSSKASEEDQRATLDFLAWLSTSDEGLTALGEQMHLSAPFRGAKAVNNPLSEIAAQMVDEGKKPISWAFVTIPSDDWKSAVGVALTQYAAGKGSWEDVRRAFVDGWAREAAKR